MTVDQVYNILKFIVRKNQLGSLPPSEFEYAFNTAQRNYYDFLVGRIEQYQYGRPVPRIGLNMTDNVVARLMPFQKKSTVAITSGILTKPADLNKINAIYTANNYKIYRIEENRFAERTQDSIDPINEANAFFIEEKSTLRVYPTTLTTCSLVYFTTPSDIRWAFTIDGTGRPIYNPSSITGLNVVFGGAGYTSPTIAFSAPAGGGVQATATLTVVSGVITAVVMTNIGSGYAGLTPTFTITGGSTNPASFGSPMVSVQPIWLENDYDELIARAAKIIGVSLKDAAPMQYGQQVIQTGE
jgi:hypothetical protein